MEEQDARSRLRDLFGSLRAEHELPWLGEVYIQPNHDIAYESMRSVAILGETGSGKSTILLTLAQRCLTGSGELPYLPIFWQPWLPSDKLEPYQISEKMVDSLFAACAEELLSFVGQNPMVFQQAKPWVQNGIISFVHLFLQNPLELTLYQLEDRCLPDGYRLLCNRFLQSSETVSFPKNLPQPRQISNLVSLLGGLPGVKGMWIFTDKLDALAKLAPERIENVLRAFFASLALFEDTGFLFKVAIPQELEDAVWTADSLQRRRTALIRLDWSEEHLIAMSQARLRYALRLPKMVLADLAPLDLLLPWLRQYGGRSPRGWLDLLRPVAGSFLDTGCKQALTAKDIAAIHRTNPPLLRVDTARHEAYLGYGKVEDLQPRPLQILEYLYTKRRPCSHEELYYMACEGLTFIPKDQSQYDRYLYPKEYNGLIDTALWRLRKVIEPDPKHPIYVITAHSRGTRLEHYW